MSETTIHRISLESHPRGSFQLWSLVRNRMTRCPDAKHIEFLHSLSETMVGKALPRVVVSEEQAKTGDET